MDFVNVIVVPFETVVVIFTVVVPVLVAGVVAYFGVVDVLALSVVW